MGSRGIAELVLLSLAEAMSNNYAVTTEDFTLRVFWAEAIPYARIPKGWISDVLVDQTSMAGISMTADTAKELALVLATHLFKKSNRPIPDALRDPHWVPETQSTGV